MVMHLLKKLPGGATLTNRFNGNTDLLEAVCAGVALVAMADGDASADELKTAKKSLAANKTIAEAFQLRDIERCMDKMLDTAKDGGRMAKARLMKQIEDVASKPDQAEAVLYAILDVADHGGIDDQELSVIKDVSTRLGLDHTKFV